VHIFHVSCVPNNHLGPEGLESPACSVIRAVHAHHCMNGQKIVLFQEVKCFTIVDIAITDNMSCVIAVLMSPGMMSPLVGDVTWSPGGMGMFSPSPTSPGYSPTSPGEEALAVTHSTPVLHRLTHICKAVLETWHSLSLKIRFQKCQHILTIQTLLYSLKVWHSWH
jgi:hypothetical protein